MKLIFILLSLLALGECRVLEASPTEWASVPREVGTPVTVHPQVDVLVPDCCGVGTQSMQLLGVRGSLGRSWSQHF